MTYYDATKATGYLEWTLSELRRLGSPIGDFGDYRMTGMIWTKSHGYFKEDMGSPKLINFDLASRKP
jgi:hypothetical protein